MPVQKTGSIPLAGIVQQLEGAKNPASSSAPQEELLAGNDDRMNQAVYADGQLWGAVNTIVKTDNGPSHVGSAYFDVAPSVSGDHVAGSITAQGYLAVNQANLLFPSIGVTSAGRAVYTATLGRNQLLPLIGLRDDRSGHGVRVPSTWPLPGLVPTMASPSANAPFGGPPAAGATTPRGCRRQVPRQRLDRQRVHRPDVHLRTVPRGHHLRGHPHRSSRTGAPTNQQGNPLNESPQAEEGREGPPRGLLPLRPCSFVS